jgi:hypothetical protein
MNGQAAIFSLPVSKLLLDVTHQIAMLPPQMIPISTVKAEARPRHELKLNGFGRRASPSLRE